MSKKITAAVIAAIIVILGGIFLYTNSNKPQAVKQDDMFNFGKFMDAHIDEINTKGKAGGYVAEELVGKEILICATAHPVPHSSVGRGEVALANKKYNGWLFLASYRVRDKENLEKLIGINTKLDYNTTRLNVTLKGKITRVHAASNLHYPIDGIWKKAVTMELKDVEIIEVNATEK